MAQSSEVAHIARLEESVINRIAAGEVVQRPSAAIKEMLENSLDAGSSQITITTAKGGLKLLQITDNGHGIRSSELGIVCERFTTSKLRHFEDLKEMSTFGFRGEALASITHVAKVHITSKTAGAPCAYRAHYLDGKMVHPPGAATSACGANPQPKPCAGVVGTTIVAEDLFYNMPTRAQAFKSPSEQHAKVLEVVTRYAIHNGDRGVGFTVKRHGEAAADFHTPSHAPSSSSSSSRAASPVDGVVAPGGTLAAIRVAYGAAVARELLPFTCAGGRSLDASVSSEGTDASSTAGCEEITEAPPDYAFTAKGYVTNANYSAKKPAFIVFINDRLVDANAVKRAVEIVYKDLLPTHSHPFVYLSLKLPPKCVDVNVHPTKKEVHFLHEDRLLGALHGALSACLRDANASRSFVVASLQPSLADPGGGNLLAQQGARASKVRKTSDASAAVSDRTGDTKRNEGDESDDGDEEGAIDKGKATSKKATTPIDIASFAANPGGSDSSSSSSSSRVAVDLRNDKAKRVHRADNKLVRSDARSQSLEAFLLPSSSSRGTSSSELKRARSDDSATNEIEDAPEGTATATTDDPDANASDNTNSCDVHLAGSAEPGAFAARCNCRNPAAVRAARGGAVGAAGASVSSPPSPGTRRVRPLVETTCTYESVKTLIAQVKSGADKNLSGLLRRHVFVGVADQGLSLVQCDTKLILANHMELSRELFFQLAVRRFGCMPRCHLQGGGLPLLPALTAALSLPSSGWRADDGPKDQLAARAAALLLEKAALLDEYFKLKIEVCDEGEGGVKGEAVLVGVPVLLDGHTPEPHALPMLLLRLASEVEWAAEQACFETIAIELANAYCQLPEPDAHPDDDYESKEAKGGEKEAEETSSSSTSSSSAAAPDTTLAAAGATSGSEADWSQVSPKVLPLVQHVLWPAYRAHLLPPPDIANELVQVACLEKLYKVFERC